MIIQVLLMKKRRNPGVYNLDPKNYASVGVGISSDFFVGYVEGDIEDLSSPTLNFNVSSSRGTLTLMFDLESKEFVGLTVGIGPGLPYGLTTSLSKAMEITFSLCRKK